jgi:hypothetical protein
MGSASNREALRSGRTDHSRSPARVAKLGSAVGITREIRQQLAGVGRTCSSPGHTGSDMGLAGDPRRTS